LNALEKWRLKLFCEKHEIDIHELDDSINYYENMKHLNEFVSKTPEDLAKEYGKILNIMEKEISVEQRYGNIPESDEQPLLLFQSVVFFKARSINLVKAYLKPYEKNLQFFKRTYLVITAQITETTTIIQALENKGVRVRFLGRLMKYQRVWQFVADQGWRKINA